MIELKLCPFCGARPRVTQVGRETRIECGWAYLGGEHNVAVAATDMAEAVRRWNTRWVDDRLEDDLK